VAKSRGSKKKENLMKSLLLSLGIVVGIFSFLQGQITAQVITSEPSKPTSIEVYFSPEGGAANAIIEAIDAAKSSILVQAYSFDYLPFARALVAAKKRNVEVSLLLDKDKTNEEKEAAVNFLVNSGVPTRLDGEHHTAHNKTIIIDSQIVITGSFNFIKHAEVDNAENLLVIRDKALAEKYSANWKKHAKHSKPYESKDTPKPVK
jgi:phosphatidylserine/phosphatidylglycerophosphate/cardiolipin synthase-like enzyme